MPALWLQRESKRIYNYVPGRNNEGSIIQRCSFCRLETCLYFAESYRQPGTEALVHFWDSVMEFFRVYYNYE